MKTKKAEVFNEQPPSKIFDLIFEHADPQALIAFGTMQTSKRTPQPHPAVYTVVSNQDRKQMIPGILDHLVEANQLHYITHNLLAPAAMRKYKHADSVTASRLYQESALKSGILGSDIDRCQKNVHQLCAITIDLDVGRPHDEQSPVRGKTLTASEALGMIHTKVLDGEFPAPSLTAFSGRGAYLLYLLKQNDKLAPPFYTVETREKWVLCCAELLKKTEELSSDATSKDFSKWYKAPGSPVPKKPGSKSRDRVIYMLYGINELDQIPRYSLDDLIDTLDLKHELDLKNIEQKFLDNASESIP